MQNKEKTLKLQSWIKENYKDWETICGVGKEDISKEEFMRLKDLLIENNYDEFLFVLMTCHFYAVEDKVEEFILMIGEAIEKEIERRGLEKSLSGATNVEDMVYCANNSTKF